jgi:hypothetical protein
MEETYADITPVRLAEGNTHAFVTITRGCDNHCAFCIVPYTRGRERSRPVESILREIALLCPDHDTVQIQEKGLEHEQEQEGGLESTKEVVLLGQNVNSYWDRAAPSALPEGFFAPSGEYSVAPGFTQRSKKRPSPSTSASTSASASTHSSRPSIHTNLDLDLGSGMELDIGTVDLNLGLSLDPLRDPLDPLALDGVRFGELLLRVAAINPEMRVRFQSPHPKDFPEEVLQMIAKTPNICNSLHMPAQSGSSSVLGRMARGYTRYVGG